jgi:hypothetical protein
MHQVGTGIPVNGDFSESHVPDQMSSNHAAGAAWQGRLWRFGYQLGKSFQDNRQAGRETADFGNLTHTVGFGVTPLTSLDLAFDLGFEEADNREVDQQNRVRRIGGAADWRFAGRSTLAASLAVTTARDDPRTMEQQHSELRLELSQRLNLIRFSTSRLAGQLFVRYARQTRRLVSPEAVVPSLTIWNLNSGITLTVF